MHERVELHEGRIEVDYFEDTGNLFLEAFDSSTNDGSTLSACVMLTVAQARAIGTALLAAAAEKAFNEGLG